jgi:hypothetical protein
MAKIATWSTLLAACLNSNPSDRSEATSRLCEVQAGAMQRCHVLDGNRASGGDLDSTEHGHPVCVALWRRAALDHFLSDRRSTEGLTSRAMSQGGMGMILATLMLTAPQCPRSFFRERRSASWLCPDRRRRWRSPAYERSTGGLADSAADHQLLHAHRAIIRCRRRDGQLPHPNPAHPERSLIRVGMVRVRTRAMSEFHPLGR